MPSASKKKKRQSGAIMKKLMDERIPAEVKNRLVEPLKPAKNPADHPIAPPRPRRRIQRQELLRRFDPYAPQRERRRTNYQDELQGFYDTAVYKGEEKRGRRFIDGALSDSWKQT